MFKSRIITDQAELRNVEPNVLEDGQAMVQNVSDGSDRQTLIIYHAPRVRNGSITTQAAK